ncbi:MAG: hypothetical protein M1839_008371 [Geoglossum umbratile]|nr:MAG: hypothetical protein M1839_008371 [Geoglossum umbratile]
MNTQASSPNNVQALLDEVSAAGSAFLNPEGAGQPASNMRLIAAAKNLVAGVRDPVEAVLETAMQNHLTAVTRTCSDLGVFELVPQTGAATLQELAAKTGADPQLLYRLMRALTASGIFKEVEAEVYSHNPLSLVYTSPFKHILKHVYQDMCQASYKLPEYLRRTAYGAQPDPDGYDLPIQYAFDFKNQNIFQWLNLHPERMTTFNLAMKFAPLKAAQAIVAYPFDKELGQNPPGAEDEVVLVDVGGGRGHVAEAIKARYPGMGGRVVVQDLKETIDEIKDPKGFEPMTHDFFTPQPIKGARAYFFSRILHDWSDKDCHRILEQTVTAMRPGHSRILISDFVFPDTDAPTLGSLVDINMLLIGGMERNQRQWKALLEGAGLELVKVWEEGQEAIIEAKLKA